MSLRKNVITKKKDNNNQIAQAAVAAWEMSGDWGFRSILVVCICSLLSLISVQAQYLPENMSLNQGEEVSYDVYFKWGILMPRAGEGRISFNKTNYKGQSASKYQLIFHTANIFESIYKMRDTIDCYYTANNSLLHSSKRSNEGGYYLIDELTFSYLKNQTSIYSHRYTPTQTKIDTTLKVASGYVFDMLGSIFFLRTLDWNTMKIGDEFPFTVAIGRDLVKIGFRYQGQAIVERDNVKYRTHQFIIDIHDEAFTQKKAAAELWVGDDENHIPIKVRSKLKIGYAEIHYKSSSNLKSPLSCRVEIKR